MGGISFLELVQMMNFFIVADIFANKAVPKDLTFCSHISPSSTVSKSKRNYIQVLDGFGVSFVIIKFDGERGLTFHEVPRESPNFDPRSRQYTRWDSPTPLQISEVKTGRKMAEVRCMCL